MAYTKTTWNNLSDPPINADNLNKIEQGIYNNSLGIDKINPSGTATTTAEIEEGQITDVIGFKSLKLKGQTSQGENPTPDNPQDVNNVSGDNVVEISNENLLKTKLPTTTQSGVTLTNNGDGTYTLNGTNSSSGTITFRINQSDGVASNLQSYEDGAYTLDLGVAIPNVQMVLTQNTTYTNFLVTGYGVRLKSGTLSNATNTFIYIAIRTGTTINNVTIRPMLVKGTYTTSTMPSFVAHQGNEFEINLEGRNLFNKYNYTEVNGTPNFGSSTGTFTGGGANSCIVIPCKPNTTYTAQKLIGGNADRFAFGCSATIPSSTDGTTTSTLNGTRNDSAKSITITTGASAKYLIMHYYRNTETTYTKQQLLDSIQIELGNQATTYIPYNENPIELCEISTYQDYIYKKDGKWWKHKAIEKLTFNGTENWSIANTGTSNFYYQVWGLATPKDQEIMPISNYFIGVAITNSNTNIGAWITSSSNVRIRTSAEDTVANFKTWLSTNTPSLYYVLATPIEEEITYTPLIRQLDELYNSGLYDVTNINQDNSSEAFVLDIEACKNNINGIVEYIRR